jgi:hypothetical protein
MKRQFLPLALLGIVMQAVAADPAAPAPFPFPVVGQPTTPLAARWDFESGTCQGWLGQGMIPWSPTDSLRAAEVVAETPHQGQWCLLIRDEKANSNPKAGIDVIGVDPAKTYVVQGFLRAPQILSDAPVVRVGAADAGGRLLRWLPVPPQTVGEEWTPFVITLGDLPPETHRLAIQIQPTGDQPPTATGMIWADDLEFHELGGPRAQRSPGGEMALPPPATDVVAVSAIEPLQASAPYRSGLALKAGFMAVDLAAVVNRGFQDEVADDGVGGWTDQGDNDLRGMTSGLVEVGGAPFVVIDPAINGGKSALVMRRDGLPAFAGEAHLAVNASAGHICLLHASAWSPRDTVVGRIDLVHADGSRSSLNVISGEEVGDWWGGNGNRCFARPLAGVNPRRSPVNLYATAFANPKPTQAIVAIDLHGPAMAGQSTWMILAITLAADGNPVMQNRSFDGKNMSATESARADRLGMIPPESLSAAEVPLRFTPGPTVAITVDVRERLRPTPRETAGISFHRIIGYGPSAPFPYHSAFPHPLTLTSELERGIRDLRVPMTRFYGVGAEPFSVEESIDRIAALLDRLGIPQEGCVLELEEQGANVALPPATWARAVRHVRERGYRFRRWEIGNEVYTGGLWQHGGKAFPSPETYVEHAIAVSQAIRAEQPEALIGVSYFENSTWWGNYVLKALAGHYDYAVAHWYQFVVHEDDFAATVIDENHRVLDRIQVMNALLQAYNPGRPVHQFDTEWGLHARPGKNYKGAALPPGQEVSGYAPNGNIVGVVQRAVRLIYYLREGLVDGAGLWGMLGRSEQPAFPVLPVDDDARGKSMMVYWLYYHLARTLDDQVVGIGGQVPFRNMVSALRGRLGCAVPLTPAVAMADDAGTRVGLMIANGSWTDAYPAQVALRGFTPATAEGIVLSHGDPMAHPVLDRPEDLVSPLTVTIEDGELRFTLPPHAVVFIQARQ